MPIIYLETLNIEKGQIDPKHNTREKTLRIPPTAKLELFKACLRASWCPLAMSCCESVHFKTRQYPTIL